jgi:hypothetical protein
MPDHLERIGSSAKDIAIEQLHFGEPGIAGHEAGFG